MTGQPSPAKAWEWLSAEPVPARPMDLDGVGADTPAWYVRAACQDTDPEAFFPSARDGAAEVALAVCMRCPVRPDCLDHAMEFGPGEDYGVWGGTTEQERKRMRRRRSA